MIGCDRRQPSHQGAPGVPEAAALRVLLLWPLEGFHFDLLLSAIIALHKDNPSAFTQPLQGISLSLSLSLCLSLSLVPWLLEVI